MDSLPMVLVLLGPTLFWTGANANASVLNIPPGVDAKVFQKFEMEVLQRMKSLEEEFAHLQQENEHKEQPRRLGLEESLDHMWLLLCGTLVMIMQAGFAMVEAGACRLKNVQNILMKNLVDVCFGTMGWFSIGWMFAYGFDTNDKNDVFAGHLQYFGHEFGSSDDNGNQQPTTTYRDWFFQWTFSATAATIVSGGVAERVQFPAYVCFTMVMSTMIYPMIVAWVWSSNGWLTKPDKDVNGHLNQVGQSDFAGSGVVHLTGGIGALVGAIACGPRKGRFDSDENFDPHSLPLVVIGTFILWFGWYGFNCGSTLQISTVEKAHQAAVVAVNTTLAGATGGIVVLIARKCAYKKYDIGGMCNGILAGLVAITAGAGTVECGWAVFIGAAGGLLYVCSSWTVRFFKVDDPLDAFSVHGVCGAWGVLASSIFDWGAGFDKYNGFAGGLNNIKDWKDQSSGLWISGFATALTEIVVVVAWSGTIATLVFLPLRLLGLLRAADEIQDLGMDSSKHSPTKAYATAYLEHGVI
jgi:Amt family ammonium transporter